MARIPQFDRYQSSIKQVKQRDAILGCIPTNIAAFVQSCGISIGERDVADAYLSTICFQYVRDLGVLSKMQFRNRDLSEIFKLHVSCHATFQEWWKQVTTWIDPPNGWPVLFSFGPEGNKHIRTAIGVNGDVLETYDPSPCEPRKLIRMPKVELQQKWLTKELSGDIMAIESDNKVLHATQG